MNVRWEEITLNQKMNLDRVLKLYDSSFPVEVREPHDVFKRSLQYNVTNQPNRFHLLVGLDGDELLSFVTAHYLAEVNIGFIVYIATNPLIRNKGLGARTLTKMEELLKKDAETVGESRLRAVILETERKADAITKVEMEHCLKRERFFQRNGYKTLKEKHYLQPPLHKNEKSVPLNLWIKQFEVEVKDIENLIQAIYREKYFKVNGIDESVLASCLLEMDIHTNLT
jgi:GNAT superfamily N-acetyltransferase